MAETWVTGAVEGLVDEAVVRRLLLEAGLACTAVYGLEGKPALLQRLAGYNAAARFAPWLVLIDLDQDAACVPEFLEGVLPQPAPHMLLRVAVREIESWLLADPGFARFLGVRPQAIPADPDAVDDPKRLVVNLARRSRRPTITRDLVPRPGAGRVVGPAYASRLIEFVTRRWQPRRAAERSASLARCLTAIARLSG